MKGEQSTAALNNKMKDFSDNAMKFQMDGGMSAYEFKDPDEPEDTTDIKGLMGVSSLLLAWPLVSRLLHFHPHRAHLWALAESM